MLKYSARHLRSATVACVLGSMTALLAGCSPELASFDDTYVPASVEENFPIKVVERPVKLALDVTPGGLRPGDVNDVIQFARQAESRGATPVVVSYATGSKQSREAANQAAGILARQGIARHSIIVTPYDGTQNRVVLAFSTKVAETKPCGDWSQNMRANQFNDSGPNFGCAFQQNFAAMVANPEDLERPRPMTAAQSASQSSALKNYSDGTWTEQTADPVFSPGQ